MKKFKVLASCLVISALGYTNLSHAFSSYFPPERISCTASGGKETCEGFDASILEVLQYSPRVPDHSVKTYHFVDGVAYNMTENRSGIAFTYKDALGRFIKLTAVNDDAKADLKNNRSAWTKIQDDLYICNAGYMSCPILVG